MEARGYQGGEGRTKFRQLEWENKDTGLLVTFVALAIFLFIFRT